MIGGQAHLYTGAGSPCSPLGDLIRIIRQLMFPKSSRVCLGGGAINKDEQLELSRPLLGQDHSVRLNPTSKGPKGPRGPRPHSAPGRSFPEQWLLSRKGAKASCAVRESVCSQSKNLGKDRQCDFQPQLPHLQNGDTYPPHSVDKRGAS